MKCSSLLTQAGRRGRSRQSKSQRSQVALSNAVATSILCANEGHEHIQRSDGIMRRPSANTIDKIFSCYK